MQSSDLPVPTSHVSSDGKDRIRDFLTRHGGAGSLRMKEETVEPGVRGWSEVYAADGYALRCEWSQVGSEERLSFSEVPPAE